VAAERGSSLGPGQLGAPIGGLCSRMLPQVRRHASTPHGPLPLPAVHAQVPSRVFFADKLPKTATGKIQRRHMVAAFMGPQAGVWAAFVSPKLVHVSECTR